MSLRAPGAALFRCRSQSSLSCLGDFLSRDRREAAIDRYVNRLLDVKNASVAVQKMPARRVIATEVGGAVGSPIDAAATVAQRRLFDEGAGDRALVQRFDRRPVDAAEGKAPCDHRRRANVADHPGDICSAPSFRDAAPGPWTKLPLLAARRLAHRKGTTCAVGDLAQFDWRREPHDKGIERIILIFRNLIRDAPGISRASRVSIVRSCQADASRYAQPFVHHVLHRLVAVAGAREDRD